MDRAAWNALVAEDDAFIEYDFLEALEQSVCVGETTSWQPQHILLYADTPMHDERHSTCLIGAIPFYIRYDSYGEYIFDHAWAEAYAQAGLNYYPKAIAAIPFTPINGQRILSHLQYERPSVINVLVTESIALGLRCTPPLSSLHFLFLSAAEEQCLRQKGFLTRISQQFHWYNQDYYSFEHYLGTLRAARRKQIKKERRSIQEQGLTICAYTGSQLRLEYMQAMYTFYIATSRHKWGRPYLNWDFFQRIYERFAHRILLFLAWQDAEIVAGAITFVKGGKLAGRYWGAKAFYPYLHFELCYYQPIEYAIQHKLQIFEAGAQGEHKFLRGFDASNCYSSHWIYHAQGRSAIQNFLTQESGYMQESLAAYAAYSPRKALRHNSARPESFLRDD